MYGQRSFTNYSKYNDMIYELKANYNICSLTWQMYVKLTVSYSITNVG